MAKYEHEWRELSHNERTKYAQAMRRINLGTWGYPVSTLRQIHLTTREGNDNTAKVFAKDLRRLFIVWRGEGYQVEYNGALAYTPEKGLLHWHGLLRIKGGYFPVSRRMLGDLWNEIHGAFVVKIATVNSGEQLKQYVVAHMLHEYLGMDNLIRNKFLFSKRWMRPGWKEVEGIAKTWVLGGEPAIFMTRRGWDLVNEIMKVWAEKRTHLFLGAEVDGKRTGYVLMELGIIREAVGGAYQSSEYEYLDVEVF